jgi:hypothetical protein
MYPQDQGGGARQTRSRDDGSLTIRTGDGMLQSLIERGLAGWSLTPQATKIVSQIDPLPLELYHRLYPPVKSQGCSGTAVQDIMPLFVRVLWAPVTTAWNWAF